VFVNVIFIEQFGKGAKTHLWMESHWKNVSHTMAKEKYVINITFSLNSLK